MLSTDHYTGSHAAPAIGARQRKSDKVVGLTRPIAEFLAEARCQGVNFERTLTIGRQQTFVGPRTLRAILRDRGPADAASSAMRFQETPWMADPFLSALGATELVAMDASPYEGADIVHDLNKPVPEHLHGRFTLVFDGGSLEHIFNVPVAITNYMEFVQVGGHLIITTAGNNLFGHGMYQFSPEFFFRVLSPKHGFKIQRLVAMEDHVAFHSLLGRVIPYEHAGRWYEVTDPAILCDRVLLNNSRPILLTIQAQRTHRAPVLPNPVYQSDYASAWSVSGTPEAGDDGESNRNGSKARERLESFAREHLSVERQMTLAFDLLPRVLPFVHPISLHREPRSRSLANRAAFHPVPRRRRRWC